MEQLAAVPIRNIIPKFSPDWLVLSILALVVMMAYQDGANPMVGLAFVLRIRTCVPF